MVGGSDEHGVPITIKAREEGVTPQEIVDRYHKIIGDSLKELGISFDMYSRTTSDTHARYGIRVFPPSVTTRRRVYRNIDAALRRRGRAFLADRYVVGKCPHCGKTGLR